jgi:hypothetical protein
LAPLTLSYSSKINAVLCPHSSEGFSAFGKNAMLCCGSGSGIWCLFDLWIGDPAWVKNQDLDHISESLETFFWVKILKFFDADPGWEKIRIRDKHPGSATLQCCR